MSSPTPSETLPPEVAAELAALDAALTGEGGAEWRALVAAVRDEAPAPRPGFRAELDERVAGGFPRPWPSWLRLPPLVPSLAVASAACLLLVVVGIAGVAQRGGFEDAAPAGGAASTASSDATAPAPSYEARRATKSQTVPGPLPAPSGALPTPSAPAAAVPLGTPGPRRVARSTSLALTTDAKGLQDAADGIVRATQDLGGVVASSRVDSSPDGGTASFALRIPSARLPEALKRFGELADVAGLSQGAEDVTGSFVSAQDRLSDARAERRALLGALGRASTPTSISSLRARLRANRATTARLEGDLRGLRRRTDAAQVDVTLRAGGRPVAPGGAGGWGIGDAARTALDVLGVLAGVTLVALAVLVPFVLVGGGAALAGRGVRRRRRDAALGA